MPASLNRLRLPLIAGALAAAALVGCRSDGDREDRNDHDIDTDVTKRPARVQRDAAPDGSQRVAQAPGAFVSFALG